MRGLYVLLALAVVFLPCLSAIEPASGNETGSVLPKLPNFERYKVDPYLDAAVKLQAIGKEKAVAVLADLAAVERHGP